MGHLRGSYAGREVSGLCPDFPKLDMNNVTEGIIPVSALVETVVQLDDALEL